MDANVTFVWMKTKGKLGKSYEKINNNNKKDQWQVTKLLSEIDVVNRFSHFRVRQVNHNKKY